MNVLETLIRCMRGPKLFKKHKDGNQQAELYTANILEAAGDKFISVLRFCFSFSYWTSPMIVSMMYRRGYFSVDGMISLGKFGVSIGAIYMVAWFFRGLGRWNNMDYVTFMHILKTAQTSYSVQTQRRLAKFDFEFWAWPTDFRWRDYNSGESKRVKVVMTTQPHPATGTWSEYPLAILGYMCANTFGRRMMYPGSTALVNTLLQNMLIQERGKLVDEYWGKRCKIETEDKNEIDTMFIDRRGTQGPNGNTLVITSEGNSGFYEIGCTKPPLDAGYSVLGWNHPGFAGSSGSPTPDQDQCAIDAMMQYAINQLGFTPDNIWLFAWSIGGYPAAWAAMNYPDIKCVTLDATFDDIEPLAIARMPQFAKGLVSYTIRKHLNLNNLELISKYPGPVLFIRRTQDEMITTHSLGVGETPMMALPSNRGNHLLIGFLKYRYPNIVDETTLPVLWDWLARKTEGQFVVYTQNGVNDKVCSVKLKLHIDTVSGTFPLSIGEDYTENFKKEMALFLAMKHMKNFDTTHCTPLPHIRFEEPWRVGSVDSQTW